MAIQIINPTTNQVVQSFEEMTDPAIDATVAQAATAFEAWKTTSYPHRAGLGIEDVNKKLIRVSAITDPF